MHTLIVKSLCLSLPDGAPLYKDLSFSVAPGDVLVLMGPSGSGKSTLLNWVSGTLGIGFKASGEVWLDNKELTHLPAEKRQLGLVLQQDYLFPHMSVRQNLLFGLRGSTKHERESQVELSLAQAGLQGLGNRDPATLSGGQRARVSLLRSLLSNPCALLLDEPFSRLDTALREQMRSFTWSSAKDLPILLVTHDEADIPENAQVLRLSGNAHAG